MDYVLLPVIYLALLVWDFYRTQSHISRGERICYLILAVLAAASAIPASIYLRLDHAGASLSGMLSLFSS